MVFNHEYLMKAKWFVSKMSNMVIGEKGLRIAEPSPNGQLESDEEEALARLIARCPDMYRCIYLLFEAQERAKTDGDFVPYYINEKINELIKLTQGLFNKEDEDGR